MPLYRNILKQAWKTTWSYKYLWFFGIFAALLGNGGEYEILLRGMSGETGQAIFPAWRSIASTGIFSHQAIVNLNTIMKEDLTSLIMLVFVGLVILLLCCFIIWLVIVSQVSLVNNSAGYLSKKKNDFKSGVNIGAKKFWPVFGMNILNRVVILLAFFLIGLPLIMTAARANAIAANIMYVVIFIVFMALVLALSFIIKYAIAFVVIKGSKFCQAIKSGWQLFIKNWLVSLEMAFVLFFINFLIGLALILVISLLAIPFVFAAISLYKITSLIGFWFVVVLALAVFLAAVVLTGAMLATFQTSSWTGLFVELNGRGGTSKIMRIANKLVGK